MKLEISVPIVNDEKAFNKSLFITTFNDILSGFHFEYNLINKLEIGILMVYTEGDNFEGYDDWYKLKKLKYKDFDKTLYYEFFLKNDRLNEFILADDDESKKILADEILNSFFNLDKLPKKIINFDKERFKSDLKSFFVEQKLL
ncbi:hypothetical protein [Flavobacterium sp. PL02]|uniref:hypothetical protein n=1 Tax=Flavobacterium sp. PL02 TaxID=3088354 RepID=UPI002B231F73|nr:hypothetical protein [Flavobacterium sp. PL02]MEA9414292.1 hypothetical protein [Flavobacterium sp. PL02]